MTEVALRISGGKARLFRNGAGKLIFQVGGKLIRSSLIKLKN